MSDFGMIGDYFEKIFYPQFHIEDEAIVTSPKTKAIIAQIIQDENNNSEKEALKKLLIESIQKYL